MIRARALSIAAVAACHSVAPDTVPPLAPGVVFTYPIDHELDVPVGARLVISFSDPDIAHALGACSVVGPDGAVDITTTVVGGGKTVVLASAGFAPGTTYQVRLGAAQGAETLPASLFSFTTRSDRPLAGPPALIAFDGSDPDHPGTFRPILDTSTIQLVFSEPLDPRSVALEPGAIELVDDTGTEVPATLLAAGIHITLDPVAPLSAGTAYELRIGDHVVDLGGEAIAATTVPFTPQDSIGRGTTSEQLRIRQPGDPVQAVLRTDAVNAIDLADPLIGTTSATVEPGVIASELADPMALGGPIAFTIPRGQRLRSTGLEIQLAGAVPSGLTTGDIEIELVADGGGRIYRNLYRSPDIRPDNDLSPLMVDLTLDLAIYASDPTGNAVLAKTVLGVQVTGVAAVDGGALAIETLGAMDVDLLGASTAPTNLVLDLITDPSASVVPDVQPPSLLASLPAADSADLAPDDGIELIFDEPIDLDRARAGGVLLEDATAGGDVASVLELQGSVLVVRPRAPLPDGHAFRVDLTDVADLAGNAMPAASLKVSTPVMVPTAVAAALVAAYPGASCALVDATSSDAGRCAGGATGDDHYKPFALAANEHAEVVFDQPIAPASIALGQACDTGSIRIEHLDAGGTCIEAVAGTLIPHARRLDFVPDGSWTAGEHYRMRLVSGPDSTCDAGELCGANGAPVRFAPLSGSTAGGGPDLVADFVAVAPTTATTLFAGAAPSTDVNGSGQVDPAEPARDDNRVALAITGTSGLITSAHFTGTDCLPATPAVDACMYLTGAMPAQLGEARANCSLPDGSTAATCVPVTLTAQTMYSTSVTMVAAAIGIGITTATGMSVMRMREPPDGPIEGYIVDRAGTPTMVVSLGLYMDAPNMSIPIAQSDMHSKPLTVALEGPVSFLPDGRIAIALRNTADVPISVGIDAPFGLTGSVKLVVPQGEMKLQLLSPPQRGSLR